MGRIRKRRHRRALSGPDVSRRVLAHDIERQARGGFTLVLRWTDRPAAAERRCGLPLPVQGIFDFRAPVSAGALADPCRPFPGLPGNWFWRVALASCGLPAFIYRSEQPCILRPERTEFGQELSYLAGVSRQAGLSGRFVPQGSECLIELVPYPTKGQPLSRIGIGKPISTRVSLILRALARLYRFVRTMLEAGAPEPIGAKFGT